MYPSARAAALATLLMLVLAGCGGPPQPNGLSGPSGWPDLLGHTAADETGAPAAPSLAPTVSPPVEPGFDYADSSEVCRRFLAALYSADTTRDRGPGDAYARASRYVTGAMAGQSAAAEHDGRWATWVDHGARLETQLTAYVDGEQMPDSTVAVYRAYRVTVTPVGADGWRGWSERSLIYCTLHRDDGGWRVAGYDLYPVRP
ncbi:hypothetical protein ACFFX1_10220 [Dactylosporangium sucinum]|uniref:Uncharacterized protein n=1 Tax=Dactylosporangium sucinum TaxID=1424081 RepID=A0A917TIE9_9ACTN|nr:hypothetical protein [Dactylosporangium sucinum]GGM24034.1 hypothetical protein GCM10007977_026480 [Dactylosporangium sucinum]